MCSYAHGGYLQAVRRITPGQITANYSDDEMVEVINSSRTYRPGSAAEIFSMAKRKDLVEAVSEQMGGTSLMPG